MHHHPYSTKFFFISFNNVSLSHITLCFINSTLHQVMNFKHSIFLNIFPKNYDLNPTSTKLVLLVVPYKFTYMVKNNIKVSDIIRILKKKLLTKVSDQTRIQRILHNNRKSYIHSTLQSLKKQSSKNITSDIGKCRFQPFTSIKAPMTSSFIMLCLPSFCMLC